MSRGKQSRGHRLEAKARTDEPLPPLIVRAELVLRGLNTPPRTAFKTEIEDVLREFMTLAFRLEMDRDRALELAATMPV